MKSNKKNLPSKQITNDDKINYIRRFICINLKKINLIPRIERFEIEYSDDSDDEFVNINDIENE
jgi:hypothetical protein